MLKYEIYRSKELSFEFSPWWHNLIVISLPASICLYQSTFSFLLDRPRKMVSWSTVPSDQEQDQRVPQKATTFKFQHKKCILVFTYDSSFPCNQLDLLKKKNQRAAALKNMCKGIRFFNVEHIIFYYFYFYVSKMFLKKLFFYFKLLSF